MKEFGCCFDLVSEWVLKNRHEDIDVKVVHGLILGQGPIEGIEHGHAWLEINNRVVDLENEVSMSKYEYEHLARLQYKVSYSIKEAIEQMLESGHKGPWDKRILEINEEALNNK